jgi:DNA (cytosine-5)-methyltransferase 1
VKETGLDTDGQKWLIETKSMSEKSAGDVISRLKRAKAIMDFDIPIDVETLLFHFSGKNAFKALTQTVRSQLKRAIRLYKEFENAQ